MNLINLLVHFMTHIGLNNFNFQHIKFLIASIMNFLNYYLLFRNSKFNHFVKYYNFTVNYLILLDTLIRLLDFIAFLIIFVEYLGFQLSLYHFFTLVSN